MDKYCVYVHIFPNGKKYYGITKNIKNRWKNGYGYKQKGEMYEDIKKYGWENIKHIILQENLNFYEAQKIENKLIFENGTNNPEKGYNHFFGHKGIYEYKTYPLQFTEEYLKHIEEVAKKQNKTIKDFILEAIKEKFEKWEKGEQMEIAKEILDKKDNVITIHRDMTDFFDGVADLETPPLMSSEEILKMIKESGD